MAGHYSGKHKKSRITDVDKAVMKELDEFAEACITDIQEAAEEAAEWAKKELRATSPKRFGDYAKGWKVQKGRLRTGTRTYVYNDKKYMLSHLLEYGHPTGNGGRTEGRAFIKPVESMANEMFEREVKRRIENDA